MKSSCSGCRVAAVRVEHPNHHHHRSAYGSNWGVHGHTLRGGLAIVVPEFTETGTISYKSLRSISLGYCIPKTTDITDTGVMQALSLGRLACSHPEIGGLPPSPCLSRGSQPPVLSSGSLGSPSEQFETGGLRAVWAALVLGANPVPPGAAKDFRFRRERRLGLPQHHFGSLHVFLGEF